MRRGLLGLALVALAATAAAARPIAIEHATVHVDATRTLRDATVVIDGGTIVALGAGAQVPAGAERIAGDGLVVTAGFVDAPSRLGLTEVSLVPDTVDGVFTDGVHAGYRAVDAFDPSAITIPVARGGGLTSAVVVPAGGLVAGQAAWVRLLDGDVAAAVVVAPVAIVAGLVGPGGRAAALERLRELLDDARFLAGHRGAFDRGQSRPLGASRLDLEALAPLLAGRIPLLIEANRAADLEALIRFARDERVRVAVLGGAEGWRVAPALAAARVPVFYTPSENLPTSFDRRRVRDDGATRMRAAGVDVVITTGGDAHGARTLRQECGLAVRAGLAWGDALAAVTSTPARVFGVGRGTVERGALADLVVWSGDPFELSTRVVAVFAGGARQSLRSHQTELLRRYR